MIWTPLTSPAFYHLPDCCVPEPWNPPCMLMSEIQEQMKQKGHGQCMSFFFFLCVLASVDIWITFFALGSCKNTLSGETQERMRLLCMTAMAFQPLPFPVRAAAAEVADVAGVLANYLLSFLRLLQSPKPGPLSSAPHLICASLPNDIH